MFWCSAILVVLVGAWITGDWIAGDGDIRRWHPGYFLPTVAGGLLAGGASAALGLTTLSHVLFGLGITSFVVLAPIIEQRLFVVPALPPPLLPTIAIEVAPPAVAGSSWLAINGGRVDIPAAVLAGFTVLMLVVQLRLIPLYRRAPFGPGFWAFPSLSPPPSPLACTGWPPSTCAAVRPSGTPPSASSPPGSCCWRRGRSSA